MGSEGGYCSLSPTYTNWRHTPVNLLIGGGAGWKLHDSRSVGTVTMATAESQLGPLDWVDWQLLYCVVFAPDSTSGGMPSVLRYACRSPSPPSFFSPPLSGLSLPFPLIYFLPPLRPFPTSPLHLPPPIFKWTNTFLVPASEAASRTACYLYNAAAKPLGNLASLSNVTEINWVFSPLDEGRERRGEERALHWEKHRCWVKELHTEKKRKTAIHLIICPKLWKQQQAEAFVCVCVFQTVS